MILEPETPMMAEARPVPMLHTPAQDSPYHAPEVLGWVEAAQAGDQGAFALLVQRLQRDVYGKAFSIVRNHQDADDVVQETFLRVYRALPGFRFESSFRTWLITITTRQALNFLDRMRSGHDSLDGDEENQVHPGLRIEETQMAQLLDEESRRLLAAALPQLPRRQKQALLLKLQNDWKYERIAQEMGTSVGSVKAHIFHAIRNLSRRIQGGKP